MIVMLACLYNKGCAEAGATYYSKTPSLREFIVNTETTAKKLAGPYVVEYAGPIAFMSAGQDAYIKLNRQYSLKYYNDNITLKYVKEW